VKKPPRRGPAPSLSSDTLVVRADEALRQERFKEAVELYKQLVKQDPRPDWKHALAEAYHGRARALATKRMFKEAAMVLENALASDATVHDPLFYLHCLIRDGQQQKAAAHALLQVGREGALPDEARAALEELTAALLITAPLRPDPARPTSSEAMRWLELALVSREALDAWVNGAPAAEVEQRLGRISFRSAFRPVRLLLKSLLGGAQEAERSKRLLEAIAPGSPFFGFRQAVEAALSGEHGVDTHLWHRLTPVQQAFVAEARGLPAPASQFLARSAEATRAGPAALFAFLLKQTDLPEAEVRSACLNLLPQIPDRMAMFEKHFGPLSLLDRHRIQALAAEAHSDWGKAERSWRSAAAAVPTGDRQAGLIRGVIFRHLANLAIKHPEVEGDSDSLLGDPVIGYLERGYEADPDHLPGVLALLGRYRDEDQSKDWHRLAEEAVQRFPDNSAVLQQATASAVARKAYKKAAGFARRLLQIDPINAGVRRQMIELQVAHARKQMRARRADLAAKELALAAEWERPEAPSALLRIAQGLVGLQAKGDAAGARLREGVALAGSGVAGWFRAALESELMRVDASHADRMRKALAQAREVPPTREAVMAVVATLAQPDAAEHRKAVASLLLGMRGWLEQAVDFDWPPAEFQAVAETLARFEAFDLLHDYARAARRRDPTNPAWRFHEILARTRGVADRLSMRETDELVQLAAAAASRQDFHAANRIDRFLDGESVTRPGRRRRPPPDLAAEVDEATLQVLLASMLETMPKGTADNLRDMVRDIGREATVAVMADQFRDSPIGPGMPEPVLQELVEAMVARALAGAGPGQAGAARRSRA
jgi:cellulose synthase operon protein C